MSSWTHIGAIICIFLGFSTAVSGIIEVIDVLGSYGPTYSRAGLPFKLVCKSDTSEPVLEWYRKEEKLNSRPGFRIDFNASPNSTCSNLTRHNASLTDSGRYFCQDQAALNRFYLDMTVIDVKYSDVELREKDTLELKCHVVGLETWHTPLPNLLWKKDGQPLKFESNKYEKIDYGTKHTLQIKDADPSDIGTYECEFRLGAYNFRQKMNIYSTSTTTTVPSVQYTSSRQAQSSQARLCAPLTLVTLISLLCTLFITRR